MKKLHIFNTMSRQKEEFIPLIDEGEKDFVGIYSCGPTVYSEPHVGNMRAYIFADILGNTIRNILGYKVKHVVNITDVGHLVSDGDSGEDKLEKGSKKEGISVWDIAKKYEDKFIQYLTALNIKFDAYPRATDYIQDQIDIVKQLEDKGYTYRIDGDGIYMDTSKISDYGKLLGPNYKEALDGLKAGARVDVEGKKNITDFALWKFSPADHKRQMEWESPWGIGFPGWHIECSAMSRAMLGDFFDIHTGGIDHIPTHHSGEIAQSECSFTDHHHWVKYWMHCQFLSINGEKLSKSLGNSYSLIDLKEKGFNPLDFRYFTLMANYGNFQDFTFENLTAAKNSRTNLIKKILKGYSTLENIIGEPDFEKTKNYEQFDNQVVKTEFGQNILSNLIESLFDDLNTPEIFSTINKAFTQYNGENELIDLINIIFYFDEKLLKLDLYKEVVFVMNKRELDIPEEIKILADKRWEAKLARDFSYADDLKKQIQEKGYDLKDGKEGYEIVLN